MSDASSRPLNSPERSKAKAGGKKNGSGLVARLLIWGVVLVLAALVLLDVRARSAAQQTADKWSELLAHPGENESGIDVELRRQDLAKHATGSPVARPAPADEAARYGNDELVEDYVWWSPLRASWSPLREHAVRVVSSRQSHDAVLSIETLGQED